MSQRYIFLKMASFRELKDEGYGSYTSGNDGPRLRRRSSASLPSNRASRAPSLRYHRDQHSSIAHSLHAHESPLVFHGTPSSAGSSGVPIRDGSLLKLRATLEYPDDHDLDKTLRSLIDGELSHGMDTTEQEEEELDKLLQDPTRCHLSKQIMFLVACVVVLATSGGLILGFGPVYSTLLREDQWSELCGPNDASKFHSDGSKIACAKQEVRLQYVFSTSFLCLSAANAFFGVFLDVAGPRLTALIGLAMSTLGNFALAYGDSHSGTGAFIIIGYSLIGAGGMGSYLAAFQILQLFEVQGLVCSALSSLFNCSGYIFMLLQVDGVTRPAFFRIYGTIVMACMVLCFLVFPTNNIMRPHDRLAIPTFHIDAPRWVNPLGLVTGMKEELKRRDLWFFAIYFGWISLIFGFAGGAIPSILSSLGADTPKAVATYTNILYPVLVNGTFIYSPLVGYIIDNYGFKVIFIACLVMVQVFIALLLVPSLHMQIVTFFVYALAQACLYALQFAYIMMCFPPELYGTLQAFLAIIAFAFGLFSYLLTPWTQMYLGGNYTIVLLVLGLPTTTLYFFLHVVQGCEDQIVQYDSDGNLTIPMVMSVGRSLGDPDEYSKLIGA